MEYSKKYVLTWWWLTNDIPAPVISDNKRFYINAKAACLEMNIPEANYSSIYKICNESTKTKFHGHTWAFATEKDINIVLDLMKEND